MLDVDTPDPRESKSFKGMRGGKAVLVESSAAVGPRRDAVAWAVRAAMTREGWICTVGPVRVEVDLYLARPVSAPKRRTLPDRRPDLDKLVRSTLDALTTAGATDDDARVVEFIARKH